MTSEWMKVMLDEIERKKIEAENARLEQQTREQSPGDLSRSMPAPDSQALPLGGCGTVI